MKILILALLVFNLIEFNSCGLIKLDEIVEIDTITTTTTTYISDNDYDNNDNDYVYDYIDSNYNYYEYDNNGDSDYLNKGFIDPKLNGGSMVNHATKTLGEPLNVIISANSDPHVLSDKGLLDFAKSIGFATECLNQHLGGYQLADLGDGRGYQKEHLELRQTYFPYFGTCWESYAGGNHFRAWRQHSSGAWFLAVSREKKVKEFHKITEDGYDKGRDELAQKALLGGYSSGYRFKTSVEWLSNLLEPGSNGINHGIEQDGKVALLTVHSF